MPIGYIPKEAIEKAVEGGWKDAQLLTAYIAEAKDHWEEIALDRSFWQSLGKALGWKQTYRGEIEGEQGELIAVDKAIRFMSLVLTGQSTEAFWRELLPANPNGRTAPNQSQ